MVQPALWLLIFGQTFAHLRVIDTGDGLPGVPGAGDHRAVGAVHLDLLRHPDRLGPRCGILAKLMSDALTASALITGKAFAAGVRSVAQKSACW